MYPTGHSVEDHPDHVSIEDACIECGNRASLRCGCCGFPLCGMHHELGGGFCPSFFSVGGVGVCLSAEVHVGVYPREEVVLIDTDAGSFHLPDEEGADVSACEGDQRPRVTLAEARDRDCELCDDCAQAARDRYQAFQDELEREMDNDGDESDTDKDGGER